MRTVNSSSLEIFCLRRVISNESTRVMTVKYVFRNKTTMAKTFVDELWDSTEEMRKTALHGNVSPISSNMQTSTDTLSFFYLLLRNGGILIILWTLIVNFKLTG